VGGADLCARAFLTAAKLIEDGRYDENIKQRYAGWKSPDATAILDGKVSLDQLEATALKNNINPQPRSGKQEQIENFLAKEIYSDPV
jgi:xylose isomerase